MNNASHVQAAFTSGDPAPRKASPTLDPNKAVQEVEFPPGVGPGAPVGPSDLVGLLCEAGVLSDFVENMRRQGAIFVSLDNHT